VINTNLPPILHRFRDTAVDRSEIAILRYPSCLTAPAEGFPWDDLCEIFSGCQWMASVPNAIEILPKIWIAWVGRTNVTDRQTTDWLPWQRRLDIWSWLRLHRIAWPRKPSPRTKQWVASSSYHTTTKPVIANCVPKLVAMATSVSISGPPSNMPPTARLSP